MDSKNRKFKVNLGACFAAGALIISTVPLICNGKNCHPISVPDLPAEGKFLSDFYNSPITQVTSLSGTITSGKNYDIKR